MQRLMLFKLSKIMICDRAQNEYILNFTFKSCRMFEIFILNFHFIRVGGYKTVKNFSVIINMAKID